MSKKEIRLWNKAKDIVTGFTWIVTSITKCLTGCDRIVLTPEVVKWEIMDWWSFDINSCEYIDCWVEEFFKEEQSSIEQPKKKVGWPQVYSAKQLY